MKKRLLCVVSLIFVMNQVITAQQEPLRFLIFGGKTGWIGQQVVSLLLHEGHTVKVATARLENRQDIEQEIIEFNPDRVMNAAGITGRPTIDWCEDHKIETIRANIIGALNLADVCSCHNIHMTNFGTGCIYEYDEKHPMGSGVGFTEDEMPNFGGSYYSKTKIMLDTMLQAYPIVLNLRVRMPISDDLNARSFVTKISRYNKVINIPNSMTVLTDLLPVSIEMSKRQLTGNYNFTNPGVISHNEVLDLYREYIDPNYTYQNFTIEEQALVIKAPRSNNELDVSKLLKEFPNIPHIKESMVDVFKRMKINLQK